jgi:hypothetical protein
VSYYDLPAMALVAYVVLPGWSVRICRARNQLVRALPVHSAIERPRTVLFPASGAVVNTARIKPTVGVFMCHFLALHVRSMKGRVLDVKNYLQQSLGIIYTVEKA